jgi:hypothetical protein
MLGVIRLPMLRNIILALFLLTLALPAMTLPVPAAERSTMAEDCHGMPADDDSGKHDGQDMRLHGCIGCIAPLSSALPATRVEPLGFIPVAEPVRCLIGTTPRPSLPPPRG